MSLKSKFVDCAICEISCLDNTMLDAHMKNVHGELQYEKTERKLEILKKEEYSKKNKMMNPVKTYKTEGKPEEFRFQCDGCDMIFEDDTAIQKHMQVTHEACFACKIQFDNAGQIDSHMKRIHNETHKIVERGLKPVVEEDEDKLETSNAIKKKLANYDMDMVKQAQHIKENLERETYEVKVEPTEKGGATNLTMNPALFFVVQKHMEAVRPGQKARIGKVTATIKENMELR